MKLLTLAAVLLTGCCTCKPAKFIVTNNGDGTYTFTCERENRCEIVEAPKGKP